MTVVATSLQAYDTVDLGRRQRDVLRAIEQLREASDVEVAAHLRWPINCVTPRRGELEAAGLVQRARLKVGPTGRKCSVWRLTPRQFALALGGPMADRRQGAGE